MKTDRFSPACIVAAVAVAVSLTSACAPALSQAQADTDLVAAQDTLPQSQSNYPHERLQRHLDRMAQRLEIKASQQAAWTAYTKTVESLFGSRPARPAADADAATIVRMRAQMTAARAQKLNRLADATATLQAALDPDQRKTLDEMVRQFGYWGRHHKDHHGEHGEALS